MLRFSAESGVELGAVDSLILHHYSLRDASLSQMPWVG